MQFRSHGGYLMPILEQITNKTQNKGILFYLFYEEYSILIKKARTKIGSCNVFVQNAQKDIVNGRKYICLIRFLEIIW